MADPKAGVGGQFYVPFPVLAVVSDGTDVFCAAGGGGGMASKEVPNVVHAMTYSEGTGKLTTIAALNTAKTVVVHLHYSKKADLYLASKGLGCKIVKLSREENTLTELCEWDSETDGKKDSEQNFAKFSPCASFIATGGSDGLVRLWDMQKMPAAPVLRRNCGSKVGEILDCDFSPDSKYLVACDAGGSCRVWEVAKDDPVDGTVITWMSKAVPKTGKTLIKLVRFVPGDQPGQFKLLLGGNGGRGPSMVGIFTADGTKLTEVITDKLPLKSMCFDNDMTRLCVGLMSGAKAVYSFPNLKLMKKTKELHSLPAQSVAFVCQDTAISGSGDRDLHLLVIKGGGGSPTYYLFILFLVVLLAGLMVVRIGLKGAALGQGTIH